MSWLRLDDGFAQHAKVIALPRNDRWTWLEILLYCARNSKNKGRVPHGIREVIPKATPQFLEQCCGVGLLENQDGSYVVHDWAIYNGASIAEKVAAYLASNPDASANAVCKAIGGKREVVIAEVHRQRPQAA